MFAQLIKSAVSFLAYKMVIVPSALQAMRLLTDNASDQYIPAHFIFNYFTWIRNLKYYNLQYTRILQMNQNYVKLKFINDKLLEEILYIGFSSKASS